MSVVQCIHDYLLWANDNYWKVIVVANGYNDVLFRDSFFTSAFVYSLVVEKNSILSPSKFKTACVY